MNGRTAKKIRQALGYNKENANPVQKRVYKAFKRNYTRIPDKYKAAMIKKFTRNQ